MNTCQSGAKEERAYVGKFHRILDEKYRYVITNQIPVPLFRIEFNSETSYVAYSICAPSAPNNCRESYKHGSGAGGICEDTCVGDILSAFVQFEGAKSTGSSCVNDTFRDPLMVESMDLGKC